jgi:hypothetical protein
MVKLTKKQIAQSKALKKKQLNQQKRNVKLKSCAKDSVDEMDLAVSTSDMDVETSMYVFHYITFSVPPIFI